VVPIVFALILGMIEIGRAYMVTHQLSNAARRGCRVATLSGKTSAQVDQEVQAALAGQCITGGQTTVYVNDAAANASTATSGDEVTVVVTVPVANVAWVPGLNYLQGHLTGKYSLRRE
jgi:Flp pilus assembly protein TadG